MTEESRFVVESAVVGIEILMEVSQMDCWKSRLFELAASVAAYLWAEGAVLQMMSSSSGGRMDLMTPQGLTNC